MHLLSMVWRVCLQPFWCSGPAANTAFPPLVTRATRRSNAHAAESDVHAAAAPHVHAAAAHVYASEVDASEVDAPADVDAPAAVDAAEGHAPQVDEEDHEEAHEVDEAEADGHEEEEVGRDQMELTGRSP